MKNFPLTVQIWLLSVVVTLTVSGLIMVFLPGMLQQFFTQQVLSILEDAQKNIQVATLKMETTSAGNPPSISVSTQNGPELSVKTGEKTINSSVIITVNANTNANTKQRAAGTITFEDPPVISEQTGVFSVGRASLTDSTVPFMNNIYFSSDSPIPAKLLPDNFRKQILKDAADQRETIKKYTSVKNNRTLLYVLRKITADGKQGTLLSYAWGSYRNDMAGILYRKLLLLMLAAIVLSWIPSLFVSRHLTRPLVEMESHVYKIGSKEWSEPLNLERKDEIGRLAVAFENMRERLLRQDQAQQAYLQNISHTLKTPIMVIQSYSQAILDGIYPKGDLDTSLLTIKYEADRTNKLVQDLLMLNKIKYMSTRDMKMEEVQIAPLIDEIAEKFSSRRPELNWDIELDEYSLMGDPNQWKVVIENLLDNATRYASDEIQISLQDNNQDWWLRIWNDGMAVEEPFLNKIFEEYYTGKGGQSGLGLAIVRHIVELHGGKVWAANENDGAAFYIAGV